MNPGDFFLMLLSLVLAALSLLAHGWTLNGNGPALIATAGGVWQLWMQWLRHRSWLRHQASGFVPGTQHLALAATVGWSLSVVVAAFWTVTTLKGLQP